MEPGQLVFDRYRIEARIGVGGTATVWRATDELLHQPVALKRIPFAGFDDERETRERALREARLAARLRGHPNVVSVFDIRADEDDLWLVLEYVPARTLADLLRERGQLNPAQAATIGRGVAAALAAAHGQGIVHRDVKPGNVLVGPDGVVKLTDFGISHLTGDPRITQTGSIRGTVAYMSPDAARGSNSVPADDVFSLGSTLYSAIEGQPPFGTAGSMMALLHVVSNGIIRPATTEGPLTELILSLLQISPGARPDAATARDRLARVAAGSAEPILVPEPPVPEPVPDAAPEPSTVDIPSPAPARRRGVLLAAAAAAVLVVLTVVPVAVIAGDRATGGRAVSADYTGIPELPESVPEIVDEDPGTSDPCGLMDLTWLRQFGAPRFVEPGRIQNCETEVIEPDGARLFVDVRFNDFATEARYLGGQVQRLGGISLVRNQDSDPGPDACRIAVVLSDDTNIYVDAARYDEGAGPDPCRPAEVAAAVVAQRLAEGGVPHDPARVARYALAGSEACTDVPAADVATVPGIGGDRTMGYADRSCFWYGTREDDSWAVVEARFELKDPDFDPEGGFTPIGGQDGYFRPEDPSEDPGEDRVGCTASAVVHRPDDGSGPLELVSITARTAEPVEAVCDRARGLVEATLPNLP